VKPISMDAVPDEILGLIYSVRVSVDELNGLSLSPGMTTVVELKTGTRRVFEYFLAPLLRYRSEALREN